ncbi:MAG TPA: hypothetical protein VH592_09455 [Gemmataceae bacterium]
MLLHTLVDLLPSFGYFEVLTQVALIRRKMVVRIADMNEQKLDTVTVALMQAAQMNHLRGEDVSAITAQDETDRFSAQEIAKADGLTITQTRQGKIGGRRTDAQEVHILHEGLAKVFFSLS